ncbi:TPA: hypothetical protein EYP66_23160 [Candidatus Poribacteria bacterium]|nr:hypothetical protein [Candidatus Poribacteria bacterium]
MTLIANQQPIIAFPVDVWEKAKSKRELMSWLDNYSQESEILPILKMKDYLTLGGKEIQIEIQLYANGEILALLPNTDLAAEGKTIDEAKHNLLLDILDDYDYLASRRIALGEELLAQCNLLEELLKDADSQERFEENSK